MKQEDYHTREMNGLTVEHLLSDSGGVQLRMLPTVKKELQVSHREVITGRPECHSCSPNVFRPDSMVQVKLSDDYMDGGFMPSMTMQDSMTTLELAEVQAQSDDYEDYHDNVIVTAFVHPRSGLRVCHYMEMAPVEGALRMWTKVTNNGKAAAELEHLSSFVISGLSPFASDDAPGRLKLHRFRSWWSNEGYHEAQYLEEIHLVRGWLGGMVQSERSGQVGTMPVRKYFPFIAVEDTEAGVCWGAQLAWAGSWQMEVSRRGDTVSISGGLADFEFGHWKKKLLSGQSLTSPKAHVACVAGDLQTLTATLVKLQESLLPEPPKMEQKIPIIFNEWCTNWGSPSHDKTLALARRLQGCGVTYLV